MGGSFEQVGDPSQSVNINPMTGDILDILMGQLEAGGAGAEQAMAGSFLDVLDDPRLKGLIDTFAGGRTGLARQAAGQAERQISGSFAGTGLYSGAFGEAVGAGVGRAYQEGATDIARTGLGFYGQAMGLAGQERGQDLGFYGQQAGGATAGLAGLGRPEFYDPAYVYEPGFLDYASAFSPLALIPFL